MSMWRFGACVAADERRRRWPEEAERDEWEASVTFCTCGDCAETSNARPGVLLSVLQPIYAQRRPPGIRVFEVEHCRCKVQANVKDRWLRIETFFFYFFAWWEGKVASKLRWNVETLFAGGDESKPRDRYLDVAAARKEGGRQK